MGVYVYVYPMLGFSCTELRNDAAAMGISVEYVLSAGSVQPGCILWQRRLAPAAITSLV